MPLDAKTSEGDALAALSRLDARRDEPSTRTATANEYARLAEFIDPSTPEGTARVAFVLAFLPRSEDAPLDLFDAASRLSPDPELADRAAVAWASISIARGDLTGAEKRLWEVLRSTRGTGSSTERGACVNLARVLSRQSRAHEALLVSGRAYVLSESLGDTIGLAASALASAQALIVMGETTEGLARMDAAQASLEGLDHPAAEALRATGRQSRLDALHASGRYDEALSLLDGYFADVDLTSRAALLWVHGFRAQVHIDAGDVDAAEEHVRIALQHAQDDDEQMLALRIIETRICHARRDRLCVVRRGRRAIRAAEHARARLGYPRFKLAELVPLLQEAGAPDVAQRCAELAAEERLQQIVAIDRCAREMPEFCVVRREDRELLVQTKKRVLEEQRECLAQLSQMFDATPASDANHPAIFAPNDDGMVRVCAWCTRVATIGDRWLPLGHLIPPAGEIEVTHGMCAECRQDASQAYPGSDE